MKSILKKIKHLREYDIPLTIIEWVLEMNANHRWFSPVVSIISSFIGWGIGLWIFFLMLSVFQR